MYVFHRLGVKRTVDKFLKFLTFHWLLTLIIRFRYYKTPKEYIDENVQEAIENDDEVAEG